MQLFPELGIIWVLFSQRYLRGEEILLPKIKEKSWFGFCSRGRKYWNRNIPSVWSNPGKR